MGHPDHRLVSRLRCRGRNWRVDPDLCRERLGPRDPLAKCSGCSDHACWRVHSSVADNDSHMASTCASPTGTIEGCAPFGTGCRTRRTCTGSPGRSGGYTPSDLPCTDAMSEASSPREVLRRGAIDQPTPPFGSTGVEHDREGVEALPGRHAGDVGHPEFVGTRGREVSLHQFGRSPRICRPLRRLALPAQPPRSPPCHPGRARPVASGPQISVDPRGPVRHAAHGVYLEDLRGERRVLTSPAPNGPRSRHA